MPAFNEQKRNLKDAATNIYEFSDKLITPTAGELSLSTRVKYKTESPLRVTPPIQCLVQTIPCYQPDIIS